MKKLLKFLLFFLLFILIVLFTAPIIFKSKIVEVANEQLEANLNAQASFNDIHLSFFKRFPNFSIGIEGIQVIGIAEFDKDTLASIETVELTVNIASLISGDQYEINKILIQEPKLHAVVLENGIANWDIAKETEEEAAVEDTTPSEFGGSILLKLFKISNAQIRYTDHSGKMYSEIENFNLSLSGDMSQDFTSLVLNTNAERIDFKMSGVSYLKKVALNAHIDVEANLKDKEYIIKKNSFSLNELTLNLDGKVFFDENEDIGVDINYATNDASFKTLLSLVPAIYLSDFEDMETAGKLKLNGKVDGFVREKSTPNVEGALIVSNASFNYPDLPKSAENIQIDIRYFYDGTQMDNTTLDVNRFHVELGGNPIDLTLNLRTPISDPFINGQAIAKLELNSLQELIPVDDIELKGKIDANIDLMGNMSTIEKEDYENFKADGYLKISNMFFNSPDMPKALAIHSASFDFSPKHLTVNNLNAEVGASDFAMKGKVSNFLPFVFNNKTIKGDFTFSSNKIDINEFMTSGDEPTAEEVEDTSSLKVIEIPANIDFALKSNIKKVYYDQFEIEDLYGNIFIKDSRLVLENLDLKMLDANFILSAEYNTQDMQSPLVDMSFEAKGLDIPKAFSSFGILKKIAPIASKATGEIDLSMDFSSFLNQGMKPILASIIGEGSLASNKIGIKGSNSFNALGQHLNSDAFKELILEDIDINYILQTGKLLVEPFETKAGQSNLIIAGEQSFDNQMDYGINISTPASVFGTANSQINQLYSDAAAKGLNIPRADNINMKVSLSGDMFKPKVKVDLKDSMNKSSDAVKKEIKETAKQAIEDKKEEAKEQARKEADKILEQAEKEADEIRKQGKIAADKIRAEANLQAENLLESAKNPIAKIAAETGAKELRDQGEKKAQKVEAEANKKADQIMEKARNKADQLLK